MKIIYQYCTYPFYDTKKYFQTELSSKLRLRRGRGDTSEDDEGLPRSPPCGSPAVPPDSFLILEKTVNHKVSNGFFLEFGLSCKVVGTVSGKSISLESQLPQHLEQNKTELRF